MSDGARIPLAASLRLLHAARLEGDVVVSAMGAAREWMRLGQHPLDWIFVPSSMGQATSLGLGMALARPDRRIIVLNGDGGMLMNLGSLVTISALAPPNLIILLFDNGVYEITGAQPTPAAPAGRRDGAAIDFAALARASGIASVYRFATLDAWAAGMAEVLAAPGPSVAVLLVEALPEAGGPRSPGPAPERARRFMEAMAQRRKDAGTRGRGDAGTRGRVDE